MDFNLDETKELIEYWCNRDVAPGADHVIGELIDAVKEIDRLNKLLATRETKYACGDGTCDR